MSYCTQNDILNQLDEDTLIQLTDDEGVGSVDEDVVTRAISDADEEVDAYLSIKYGLPFEATPNLVRLLSVDLAICHLYARRDDTIPETRKTRCEEARRKLDKLATGKMKLDVPKPGTDTDHGVGVSTSKGDRVFSRGRDSDSSTGTLDNY